MAGMSIPSGPRALPRSAGARQGTTLVETTVVMAVLVILAAVGLPSFLGLKKRQQAEATMHLLASHLASARASAISYNVPVIVCPSAGDGRCLNGTDWSRVWLSFRDPDGNRQPDEESDIYRNDTAPQDPRMRILSTTGRPYVRYQPSGMNYGSNLTLRICYDGEVAGSVIVNNSGRIRSSRSSSAGPCPD